MMASAAVPVRADPIQIVSGSVFIETPGTIPGHADLVGTGGFSLTARAGFPTQTGLFAQCAVPECAPGTRVNFDLDLSGASGFLGGVMTIGGDGYEVSESVTSMADVFLRFDGSFIAPDMGPAQTTVSAPFSLTGRAFALTPLGEFAHDVPLFGRGIGTATLIPYPPEAGFAPSWMVESVRFDFAQPVPEPATVLLLGTGALAALRARKNRRGRA
jgi:hypothetical protein